MTKAAAEHRQSIINLNSTELLVLPWPQIHLVRMSAVNTGDHGLIKRLLSAQDASNRSLEQVQHMSCGWAGLGLDLT